MHILYDVFAKVKVWFFCTRTQSYGFVLIFFFFNCNNFHYQGLVKVFYPYKNKSDLSFHIIDSKSDFCFFNFELQGREECI